MNTRFCIYETAQLHAELYHRAKIAALRAEGERLRKELMLRGVNPTDVLSAAELPGRRLIADDSESHRA